MIEYFNPSSEKAYRKVEKIYSKNPNKCIKKMQKLCSKGNKQAANFLKREMINRSYNAPNESMKLQCIAQSNQYLKMAADFGCSDSQYDMGKKYEIGDGVEKNPFLSFKYYLMAARNGDVIAQSKVGRCYALGIGVKQNAKEAKYWEMMAANQGETISMINIAKGYENGKGLPKNNQLSRQWYEKAYYRAKYRVDTNGAGEKEYYEQNELNAMDLAIKGIRRIDVQVLCEEYRECTNDYLKRELFIKILDYANQGEWRAQFEMGLIYHNEENYELAKDWYMKAADNGSSGAMTNLALLVYHGLGVKPNY